MGNDKNNGYIQVIERAITILDLFTEQNSEWRFSDLVTASGLNKSTVFNIVNTLKGYHMLEQDDETKKYRLGVHLIYLGNTASKSLRIIRIAEPFMLAIRSEINETVQLARLDGMFTVYLAKVECAQPIQTYSVVGDALPAYATGLGRAILAYKNDIYIDKYFPEQLKPFTSYTITSRDALKQALAEVRKAGIACDRREFSEDLICFAAPVFAADGTAVYSISVSTPMYRMTEEKESRIIALLKEKAMEISRCLGYAG